MPGETARDTRQGVAMHEHRILLHHTAEGWAVKRPGWPIELTATREWAECLAQSIAYELHETSNRPTYVVLAAENDERVLFRFGHAAARGGGTRDGECRTSVPHA